MIAAMFQKAECICSETLAPVAHLAPTTAPGAPFLPNQRLTLIAASFQWKTDGRDSVATLLDFLSM